MRKTVISGLLFACIFAGAAGAQQSSSPRGGLSDEDILRRQPYYGLNERSYGRLSPDYQLRTMCGGSDAAISGLSRSIVDGTLGRVLRPMQKRAHEDRWYDPAIVRADLQNHFPVGAAWTGHNGLGSQGSPVALLDRTRDKLTFWYVADVVKAEKVMAAATEYCGRSGMTARYLGGAQACGQSHATPVVIEGQGAVRIQATYVIASYACAAGG